MRAMDARGTAARWAALAAATALVAWLVALAGLPSSALFGALIVGVGAALLAPDRLAVPPPLFTAAQATAGVVLGTFLDRQSLDALGAGWLPLALVTAATLAISLAAGALLARMTALDLPTAALGMVAGGASGIVGISDELGADDRLVAFMQYLRVLVIVALTPVLAALVFPGAGRNRRGRRAGLRRPARLADHRGRRGPAAALAGHRARIPGGALLVPMAAAAVLKLAVPGGEFAVPPAVGEVAFALIGLQVGLKFTRRDDPDARPAVRARPARACSACSSPARCSAPCSRSPPRSRCATRTWRRRPAASTRCSPVALGSNADAGFILAAQGLRLIVMIALAPIVVRWLVRRGGLVSSRR